MILAAFTDDRIIGVDVEYMRPSVECDSIVTHFFSERKLRPIVRYLMISDGWPFLNVGHAKKPVSRHGGRGCPIRWQTLMLP